MLENDRKPSLRFKGFNDAWEQRKVGELLIERNEQAPMSDDYPLMAFVANEGVSPKGERYDRSSLVSDTENKLYKRTDFGDFIYSSNNLETGSIGLNKYGKASISPVYSIFQPTAIADSDFLGRRLVRKDFTNAMIKWRQGVIYGQWRIHESDFVKIDVPVPSVDEQQKIGLLLDGLDSLITLHQRKYDKLVSVKKALLDKMFPETGNDVPKIRFKGFTDAWEQRKYGEIFNYERPDLFIVSSEEYSDTFDTPVLTANKGFILGYTNETRTYNKPCIIFDDFTLDTKYVDFPFMVKSSAMKMLTIKEGFDLRFSYELLSTSKIENLGHARHYISVVQPTTVRTPKLSEQQEISRFFQKMDTLITLHQCKYEKLKNIKKSLLQKMFA